MHKNKLQKYGTLCCVGALLSSAVDTVTLVNAENMENKIEVSTLIDKELPQLNDDLGTIEDPLVVDNELPEIPDNNQLVENKKINNKQDKLNKKSITKNNNKTISKSAKSTKQAKKNKTIQGYSSFRGVPLETSEIFMPAELTQEQINKVNNSDKTWGTAKYTFDNGIFIIGAGEVNSNFPVNRSQVKEIRTVGKVTLPSSTQDMFSSMNNLKYIDGSQFDFSGVVRLFGMFRNNPLLKKIEGMGQWKMLRVNGKEGIYSSRDYGYNGYQDMFNGDKSLEELDFTNWVSLSEIDHSSSNGPAIREGYQGMLDGMTGLKKIIAGPRWNPNKTGHAQGMGEQKHEYEFNLPAVTGKDVWHENSENVADGEAKYNYIYPWVRNRPIIIGGDDNISKFTMNPGKTYIKETMDKEYVYGTLMGEDDRTHTDSLWIYDPETKQTDLYQGNNERLNYFGQGSMDYDPNYNNRNRFTMINELKDTEKIVSHGKITLPMRSMGMFKDMPILKRIEGMGQWNTSAINGQNGYGSAVNYGFNGFQDMFNGDKSLEELDFTNWVSLSEINHWSSNGPAIREGYQGMLDGMTSLKKIIVGPRWNPNKTSHNKDMGEQKHEYEFRLPAVTGKDVWHENSENVADGEAKYNYIYPWVRNHQIIIGGNDTISKFTMNPGKTYIKETMDKEYVYGTLMGEDDRTHTESLWIYDPDTKQTDLYQGNNEQFNFFNQNNMNYDPNYNDGIHFTMINELKDTEKIVSHGKIILPMRSMGMFRDMPKLKRIEGMGQWDTKAIDGKNGYGSAVDYGFNGFQDMFYGDKSLEELDFTNWISLSEINHWSSNGPAIREGYQGMLDGLTSLKKIIVGPRWDPNKTDHNKDMGEQKHEYEFRLPAVSGKDVWHEDKVNNVDGEAKYNYIYPWVRNHQIIIGGNDTISKFTMNPGKTYIKETMDKEYVYGTLMGEDNRTHTESLWIYDPIDKVADLYQGNNEQFNFFNQNSMNYDPNYNDGIHFTMINEVKGLSYIVSHGKITLPMRSMGMFRGMTSLERIEGMGDWDVSKISGDNSYYSADNYGYNAFQDMFYGDSSLKVVDFSKWKALAHISHESSNPPATREGYQGMLEGTSSLKRIIVGGFNVNKSINDVGEYSRVNYLLQLPGNFVNVGNGTLNKPQANKKISGDRPINSDAVYGEEPQKMDINETYVREPSTFNKNKIKIRFVDKNNNVLSYGQEFTQDETTLVYWDVKGKLPAGAELADGQYDHGRYIVQSTPDTQYIDVKLKTTTIDYNVNVKDNFDKPVVNENFDIIDNKGNIVDTVTTDNNGNIHVVLPPEDYIVRPSKPIEGFVNPKDIIITPQNPSGEIIMEHYDFKDQLPETGRTTTILLSAMLTMSTIATLGYISRKNRKDLNI